MSDVTQEQPVSTEQPASTAAPEQSLEDVFQSYKVESEPSAPQQQQPQQQQPVQQPAPQAPHIPDAALDPDGFKRWAETREADTHGLRQAIGQVAKYLTAQQQESQTRREEADIAKAVGFLKEKAPGVDDDVLEVYLGARAKKDPRLLSVWNNREKNPKAWDAALKAIGNEAAGKFSVRADGQLVENQRAMKAAQSTMGTAQPQASREEEMGRLNGSAFDQAWERIKSG